MRLLRWRLHEPTEGPPRWTRVHICPSPASERTLCGIEPDGFAYDMTFDEWIPADAPRCKRCARKAAKEER